MIRSLGLTRLNQVVERQDTPQIRGHWWRRFRTSWKLLIRSRRPPGIRLPEYTIYPPEPKAAREEAVAVAESVGEGRGR